MRSALHCTLIVPIARIGRIQSKLTCACRRHFLSNGCDLAGRPVASASFLSRGERHLITWVAEGACRRLVIVRRPYLRAMDSGPTESGRPVDQAAAMTHKEIKIAQFQTYSGTDYIVRRCPLLFLFERIPYTCVCVC